MEPGQVAIGTWSGGRFMHFGERLDEDRLRRLLRPDREVTTVITADTYGAGDADRLLGEALSGLDRGTYGLLGAVGHDFYTGDRDGPRGFPRFTDPRLRGPEGYGDYLRMATERSLERLGTDRLDLLLLHNPDRVGYSSEQVWDAMAALREDGLTDAIGVAPGPANGFTLDLLACFERFGDRLDWAMVILNPLEPWPGELVLRAAERSGIRLITRVVDYGGLFWDDVLEGHRFADHDHRRFRPEGWVERGRERLDLIRPIAERHRLSTMQLACQWNLAQPAVACVAPTLIQERAPGGRAIEAKRAELAALPEQRLSPEEVAEIRRVGDNFGSMDLKGANPGHEGEERPDRWPVSPELRAVAERWGIEAERDLIRQATTA